jgi:hypothetical protein
MKTWGLDLTSNSAFSQAGRVLQIPPREQWEPATALTFEATSAVAQDAIASLRNRVNKLEGRR